MGIAARKRRSDFVNLAGQQIGEWTVSAQCREHQLPSQGVTQWFCTCSCGTQRWVGAPALQGTLQGRRRCSKSCGGPAHSKKPSVGDKLGDFTILSMEEGTPPPLSARLRGRKFPLHQRSCMTLQCSCGRIRTFAVLASTSKWTRITCGCNGIDPVSVLGDPNLPSGIHSYNNLIEWAGCTRQAHYALLHRRGLSFALDHLADLAESNHPGEGWRIRAVIGADSVPPKQERQP